MLTFVSSYPLHVRALALVSLLGLVGGLWGTAADAATYYIGPSGSDANTGLLSSEPLRTWPVALAKLAPGDTLYALDGTYTKTMNGQWSVNCASGFRDGTSAAPITVKALHERQALLSHDGSYDVIFMTNCDYWILDGLRLKNADNSSNTVTGSGLRITKSSHMTIRRLLITHNNRYANSHMMAILDSTAMLVEENELYWFHRHGISLGGASGSTTDSEVRRNYANSRGYVDIAGGFGPTVLTIGGDDAFNAYPGSNNMFENNISENNAGCTTILAGPSDGNSIAGTVCLNNSNGVVVEGRSTNPDDTKVPKGTNVRHLVVVGGTLTTQVKGNGISNRSGGNSTRPTLCQNCTFVGLGGAGVSQDAIYPPNGGSIGTANILTIGGAYGLYMRTPSYGTWAHNYVNAFKNTVAFSPTTNLTQATTSDPAYGACYLWQPDSSPMRGAGINGTDIGARVLYLYEGNALTSNPMWTAPSGKFVGCGAVVSGVNDVAGDSCQDVHQRLHVNSAGCAFPAGYAGTPTPPSPPRNLAVQ